jgi:hypothetical protein
VPLRWRWVHWGRGRPSWDERNRITALIHNVGPFGSLAKVGWGLDLALAAAVSLVLQSLVVTVGDLRTEQIVSTPVPPKPMARAADGGLNLPHKTGIFKDEHDAERIDQTVRQSAPDE